MTDINRLASQLKCSPDHIRQAAKHLGQPVDSAAVAEFVAQAKSSGGVPAFIRQQQSQSSQQPGQPVSQVAGLASFSDLLGAAGQQAQHAQAAINGTLAQVNAAEQFRVAIGQSVMRRQQQALQDQLESFLAEASATLAQIGYLPENVRAEKQAAFWEFVNTQPIMLSAPASEQITLRDLIKADAVRLVQELQQNMGVAYRMTTLGTTAPALAPASVARALAPAQ